MKRNRWICLLLAFCLTFSVVYAAGDSDKADESAERVIVSMGNKEALSTIDGITVDTKYVKSAKYSAKWDNHPTNKTVEFSGVPSDWRDYEEMRFWMYSEKATNEVVTVLVYCKQRINGMVYVYTDFKVNWVGWKQICLDLSGFNVVRYGSIAEVEKIQFTCFGWNSTPLEGTCVYFDNIRLSKQKSTALMPSTAAQFETLRKEWKEYLIGDGTVNQENEEEKKKLKALAQNAKGVWQSMYNEEDAVCLWTPASGYGKPVNSSTLSYYYSNIRVMAEAYATPGNEYYHNTMLKQDILFALEWMYQNMYGPSEMLNRGWRDTTLTNWWDWQIGAPTELINTLLMLQDTLSDAQIKKYVAPVEYFTPQSAQTDANKASMAYVILGSAVLAENTFRFANGRNAIESLLYFTDGDESNSYDSRQGFYRDGSYIYHDRHAMNGTYGLEMLKSVSPAVAILGRTPYGVSAAKVAVFHEWIYQGYEPLTFDGGVMSIVRGRYPGGEHAAGATEIGCILDMLPSLDEENAKRMKSYIKYTVLSDTVTDYSTVLRLSQLRDLEKLMQDDTVVPREHYDIAKVYGNMDKAVWQRDGYAVGLSMSSSRIFNYESISGCNQTGWYMGDGMLLFYDENDQSQYEDSYWTDANKYRLPGTTVDTRERQAISISNTEAYLSSQDFVGGVSLDGKYAVCAMALESFHSEGGGKLTDPIAMSQPLHRNDLTANKAYFMFDDEVVALGSGIHSTMDAEVETTVENRRLDAARKVIAGGSEITKTKETSLSTDYLSIEGLGGYYFPDGAELHLKRGDFLEAWFSHGKNPENAGYVYVLLPKRDEAAIKQYTKDPDITVLANTASLQAVKEKNTGLCGMVFWQSGSFGDVTAQQSAIVMTKTDGSGETVSLADPTHKLESVTVRIPQQKLETAAAEDGISLRNEGGYTYITANTKGARGKSFAVRFHQ